VTAIRLVIIVVVREISQVGHVRGDVEMWDIILGVGV
jgi:hypothetical protein